MEELADDGESLLLTVSFEVQVLERLPGLFFVQEVSQEIIIVANSVKKEKDWPLSFITQVGEAKIDQGLDFWVLKAQERVLDENDQQVYFWVQKLELLHELHFVEKTLHSEVEGLSQDLQAEAQKGKYMHPEQVQ